jgi:antitoxin (DNA-binding transcriptional repressor) of toxin-antitoxin stability system
MMRVGIREFKAHMGQYIARIRAGETIMLTDRGQDAICLTPGAAKPEMLAEARLEAARSLGIISGGTGKPAIPAHGAPNIGSRQVSDLLLEDRG